MHSMRTLRVCQVSTVFCAAVHVLGCAGATGKDTMIQIWLCCQLAFPGDITVVMSHAVC